MFDHRATGVGEDRAELLTGLEALAAGEPAAHVVTGTADEAGGTVFVFPGQGSQWAGMARELLDSSEVFAKRLAECADALAPHTDWSLLDVVRGAPAAPALDRVDVVQPVLFAVMVSLAELWRSLGIVPDAVVGHSQGEIAAAQVAGALSLDDAARVVALRSRAIVALAGNGGMASVALPAHEIEPRLARFGGRVHIATVNGPSSTTVSADAEALEELLAECAKEGVDARRIAVDYASHSPHVDVLRDHLMELLSGITPRSSELPFYSTVTGEPLDTATLDAAYWFRNLRQTVQFERATRTLLADGHRTFVEVSPHPVLAMAVQDTVSGAEGSAADALVTGTLRRDDGGWRRFLTSAAQIHAHGTTADWSAVPADPGARTVELPTYAFQRERHWLDSVSGTADVASAGLLAAEHALLGAAVPLADSREMVFTGRLPAGAPAQGASLSGAVLAELVLHAGEQVECPWVDELTVLAPLGLSSEHACQLQVTVRAADASGRREILVHSRPEGEDGDWTRHAEAAVLPGTEGAAAVSVTDGAWPPPGAVSVDLADLADLAPDPEDDGAGPQDPFRGVQALWRLGADLYAEVALKEELPADIDGFGIHPELLDAASRTLAAALHPDGAAARRVVSWAGLRLYATQATSVRVRLTALDADRYRLALADPAGQPVAAAETLTLADPSDDVTARPQEPYGGSLFHLDWPEVPCPQGGTPGVWALLGDGTASLESELARAGVRVRACADTAAVFSRALGAPAPGVLLAAPADSASVSAPDSPADHAHRATEAALELLTERLTGEGTDDARLVVLTRGAVAVRAGDDVTGLAGAAVWGLVRSAQAEHPDRVMLIDIDDTAESVRALPGALAAGEPQLALRAGRLHIPRLTRTIPGPQVPARALDPGGTVLVTGGTGTLGRLVARHLVTSHGIRHLLLTSRKGPDAEGADEIRAELAAEGAEVTVAACDVADPEALRAALSTVDADHPLTAVVHAAGVLADATLHALTPDRIHRVLRPKADAAWNLHQQTSGLDLAAFVLFSSVTGVIGTPGQANYAAANAFLDGLAAHRHAHGQPATSLAWGYWAQSTGMTGHLSQADVARMARTCVGALQTDEALSHFDAALAGGLPALVPARIVTGSLRDLARGGPLPAVLRGLVRAPSRRRAAGAAAGADSWELRLSALTASEQNALLLELVSSHAAAVLGGARRAVEAGRAFKELGFDSLTAVELRNRLSTATGLRLPATVVFNHPTAAALAAHVRELLAPGPDPAEDASPLARLDSLEAAIGSFDPADAGTRDAIAERLHVLLRKLEQPSGDLMEAIQSATPDEIFELIDNRLGRQRRTGSDNQGDIHDQRSEAGRIS
ncbi:MAG: SDR family NAD(P)-dependent oxidoreductase [Streptomyces sp.]|uniref:type I polyketide synthase n=1 Tax=Streptomyces sp. TaxID=1931 RepID=UPI003D6C0CE0